MRKNKSADKKRIKAMSTIMNKTEFNYEKVDEVKKKFLDTLETNRYLRAKCQREIK